MKQFTDSPTRPLLVSRRTHTSAYLGNLSYARQSGIEHWYSSTFEAPQAISSPVAWVMPIARVGAWQLGQCGVLTNVKKSCLNQLYQTKNVSLSQPSQHARLHANTYPSNARITQSWYPYSGLTPSPFLFTSAWKS